MADIVKDDCTVLVIGGTPYSLVKDKTCRPVIVCDKCDLRDICCTEYNQTLLVSLCMNGKRSSAWYFVEDWDIEDYGIKDYLGVQVEEFSK